MKKIIILLIISLGLSSCLVTRTKLPNGCIYYYRPSLKDAKWRYRSPIY